MAVIRRVRKEGNSLQVVLPREFCHALKIKRGDYVYIALVERDEIRVTKLEPKKPQILDSASNYRKPVIS